jgi:hypothetical protein
LSLMTGEDCHYLRQPTPIVYVFAASKMEAPPVLVLAARDGASSDGSGALIIGHGGDRFVVIVTGMGTRNAEARAEAALVSCPT